MQFSVKLKSLRKQSKMSQEQLAQKLNVTRQAITKWEGGSGIPDIENIIAISALFNISLDELLLDTKSIQRTNEFIYESNTEYDIDSDKHIDIHAGSSCEIIVERTDSEKILVGLFSNDISSLESSYKVKIDDQKSKLDVEINNIGDETKARAKEFLFIKIFIPSKKCKGIELNAITKALRIKNTDTEEFEFEGKVSKVYLNNVNGRLELDSSEDMKIFCSNLNGNIDINQTSATSIINIPIGTEYSVKKKGFSNRITYTKDNMPYEFIPSKDKSNTIELNGLNSELIINEFSGEGEL